MVSATQAREWLARWDRQQETYIADREERFEVIGDVIAAGGDVGPRIVDLGCGPGSLTVRLADRFPRGSVVGVDADPLLLGLAEAAYGDRDNARFVSADLRVAGWPDALGDGYMDGVDAVVSTTALHWLTIPELGAVYRAVAALLRPGGLFVDGDHFRTGSAGADALASAVRTGREARVRRRAGDRDAEDWSAEDWEQWWAAVDTAPDLAELVGERGARPLSHRVEEPATLDDHVRLLRAAGFAEVGVVWQHGDDRVLTATRSGAEPRNR